MTEPKHTCDPEMPVDAETCAACRETEAQMRREYLAQSNLRAARVARGEVDACDHADLENGHCLDCGADRTEDMMARAYDAAKDARKYGDCA